MLDAIEPDSARLKLETRTAEATATSDNKDIELKPEKKQDLELPDCEKMTAEDEEHCKMRAMERVAKPNKVLNDDHALDLFKNGAVHRPGAQRQADRLREDGGRYARDPQSGADGW